MNRKSKILVLLEQSQDYKLLTTLLEKDYEIVNPATFPDATLHYDLIIVDGISHSRYKNSLADEKTRANPLFLPVLILTGKKDVDIAASFLWKTVDELIVLPVNKTELHARVEMLLRTRKQSIELDYSHNRLIKQNQEQLNLAVKSANVGLWDWNLETNKVYYSPEWKSQIGFEDNEISNETSEWSSRVHPDDLERCQATITKYIKNPWPDYNLEFRFRHKNDNYIWIYTQASLILNDEGNPLRMVGSHVDITAQKKSESDLKESEKKYRLLFHSNPHPMWVYDLETLNFLEVNHAAVHKYGYSLDEFLAMNLKDIRPTEDFEKLDENLRKESDEFSFSGEWRHKNKNGDILLVEIISHSINYAGRDARLVLANDITERKLTEDKLKLYTRAIEQSPVSINITDSHGDIVYVNSGFSVLSGYTQEEVIGKNPRFLKSGVHSNEFYMELWETLIAGKKWSSELCNRNKDGKLYWVQATISPVIDSIGRITHFVAVKEDISERKKFVEDLKIAKDKAEESDRLKSAFLANMSHEIRTPMNGILGFTSLLLEPNLSSDDKEDFIKIIHQSGKRMLNTVTDLVEISKIEAGIVQIVPKETDINKSVGELIRFFRSEAEKKGLQLILIELLPESARNQITDQNKLDSILTNLLKNAIKFTDSGSISFACHKKDNNLEFYIKDTGIGIPLARRKAIFERFIQADIADKRAFQGSGLGLAIAKSYIEMLGGKIWVESEEGKGSTFYFTLPVKNATQEKSFDPDVKFLVNEREKLITNKLKILIAEDDETSRKFISLIVKDFSAEILKAGTGIETVELCINHKDIDLILMDIQMPGMNGYEATRQIREFNRDVIIIAQTAFALSGDKEKAIDAGCNDYITKPIDRTKFESLLQKYFE